MSFIENPGCWNCLAEYTCNWEPAKGNDRCKDWMPDPEGILDPGRHNVKDCAKIKKG